MTGFCTLFDSAYLSRGLLLYDSLKRHMPEFHLYIFAFDTLSDTILRKLNLPDITVISLSEFENENLLAVKSSRTRAEYCWTCTSSVIDYVLIKYGLSSCTYLDADLFFYDSPEILLGELRNGKKILITEHRYSWPARIFEQKRAGRFCVQFITFSNEQESLRVLEKWRDKCIDWCYARYEDGKFGDQKYLDNWPVEYPNVHVLENQGGGVAPWNARQYKFRKSGEKIIGKRRWSAEEFNIVFFHFHFVRGRKDGNTDLGWNRLTNNTIEQFYIPYLRLLEEKERFLEAEFTDYSRRTFDTGGTGMKEKIKSLFKELTGYNIINAE